MVSHPVDHNAETEPVGLSHEVVEILKRTELRVDFAVVLHCIIRSESTLAAINADRIDRHEPYDVHTHLCKAWKFLLCGSECSCRSVLTYIHFINHRILEWLLLRSLCLRARQGHHGSCDCDKDLLHMSVINSLRGL